jgi:hypothetical protein
MKANSDANRRWPSLVVFLGAFVALTVGVYFLVQNNSSTPPRDSTETPRPTIAVAVAAPSPAAPPRERSPAKPFTVPQSLFVDYGKETDLTKRLDLVSEAAREIPDEEIAALLKEHGSRIHPELRAELLQRWMGNDPAAGAAWASSFATSHPEQIEILPGVAALWANQDLSSAVAWGRTLSDETQRAKVLVAIGYEAARQDPKEALRLASDLAPGEERDGLIVHAAAEWATAGTPESVVEWAKLISDVSIRERVLSAVAATWGDENPVAAANLAIQALPPGPSQDNAVMGILQRWAQKDPAAAAAWVKRFPEGPLRDTALENLVKLSAPQSNVP